MKEGEFKLIRRYAFFRVMNLHIILRLFGWIKHSNYYYRYVVYSACDVYAPFKDDRMTKRRRNLFPLRFFRPFPPLSITKSMTQEKSYWKLHQFSIRYYYYGCSRRQKVRTKWKKRCVPKTSRPFYLIRWKFSAASFFASLVLRKTERFMGSMLNSNVLHAKTNIQIFRIDFFCKSR